MTASVAQKKWPGNPAWVKGAPSANPSGRPKVITHIRDLAREASPECIAALRRIVNDKDEKASAVVAAANALLDRAWGRPETHLTIERDNDLSELDLAALRAIVERAGPQTLEQVSDAVIVPPAVPQLEAARTSSTDSEAWE